MLPLLSLVALLIPGEPAPLCLSRQLSAGGDYMLGGLFPMCSSADSRLGDRTQPHDVPCPRVSALGLLWALAVKMAVEEINNSSTLLPGLRLGHDLLDTGSEPAAAMQSSLRLMARAGSSSVAAHCDYAHYRPRVLAVIGPHTSELALVTGKLFGFFLVPQVSYGASIDRLSQRESFPSFFRTVSSDRVQVRAMVALLHALRWNWVAALGSDDEYGRQGLSLFSSLASAQGICVAHEGLVPLPQQPGTPRLGALQDLLRRVNQSRVQVVVVFASARAAQVLFAHSTRNGLSPKVWVASEAWLTSEQVMKLPGMAQVGTVLGFLQRGAPLPDFPAYVRGRLALAADPAFCSGLADERPGEDNVTGPRCLQCDRISPDRVSVRLPHHQTFAAYAAVYGVAQALHNALACDPAAGCLLGPLKPGQVWPGLSLSCSHYLPLTLLSTPAGPAPASLVNTTCAYPQLPHRHRLPLASFSVYTTCTCLSFPVHTRPQLLQKMYNTSFHVRGLELRFDASGNVAMDHDLKLWVWEALGPKLHTVGRFDGHLRLQRHQMRWHTPGNQEPVSQCSPQCEEGQVRRVKGFHSCCYDCTDCTPGSYQHSPGDTLCSRCGPAQWSPARSSRCFSRTPRFLAWGDPVVLMLLLALGLVLSLVLGALGLFLLHQHSPLVRASGGSRASFSLACLGLGCLSVLLLPGRPSPARCLTQPPLLLLPFTGSLSMLFLQAAQVFAGSALPQGWAGRLQDCLRGPRAWLAVLLVVLVQAALCGWSLAALPMWVEADWQILPKEVLLRCGPHSWVSIALMHMPGTTLAFLCFLGTFLATSPAGRYNQAHGLTFAALAYLLTWTSFVPLSANMHVAYQPAVLMGATLLSALGVLATFYLPKCYLLLWRPHCNTPQFFLGEGPDEGGRESQLSTRGTR